MRSCGEVKWNSLPRCCVELALSVAILGHVLIAQSATFTWTNLNSGNASGSWTNRANWSGAILPTTINDLAIFNTLDISADSTVTLDGNQAINALFFGDTNSSSGANWLLSPGSPANSTLTLGGSAPRITVSGLAGGKTAVLGAPLAGTNGFTKAGPSFLTLTATNMYSGTTVIAGQGSDGRISFASDFAFGTGKVQVGVLNGGSGDSQVWFQPAGNRALTNSLEIQTVRWIIDWNPAGPYASGDLTLNGPLYLNQGTVNVRDIYCGKNLTVNGPVTSSGGLNKQGGSTLTLNGTNTYSGATVLNSGTIVVNGRNPGTGAFTVNNGTTLAGTGLVAGAISVLDGGNLAPGNAGAGVFTCGTLIPTAKANLNFALGATTNPANGFIQVNGSLTLAGQLNIRDLGGFSLGVYTSFWYSGNLIGNSLIPRSVPKGRTVSIQTNVPHYVLFQVLDGVLNPTNGQTVPMDLASPLTLSYVQVPGAVAYDLFLATNGLAVFSATTNTSAIYLGRTNRLAVNVGTLLPNTTYFWRADGLSTNGTPIRGALLSFTTGAAMVDLMPDTWVATDALGRSLPGNAECGQTRANRPIGLFYFLWHGSMGYGSGTNWDVSQWIASHPFTNAHNPWADQPIFETAKATYYWGEPELGYYKPNDPWVLRRHIALLTLAGVDVLIFDYSNAVTYDTELYALCDMIRQMRCEGFKTNLKIAFLTHAGSAATVSYLYNTFYSQNRYPDLWFYWLGKPLVLGYVNGIDSSDPAPSAEVQNFFTWRTSWADVSTLLDEWQWIDSTTPQNWGYDTRSDIAEQLPVTCGGWSTSNLGRSYTNHTEPAYDNYHLPIARTQDRGLFFAEEMFYGLKYDPLFLFITGWNEWIAGSFAAPQAGWPSMLGNPCPLNGYYFVDEYDEEYSRDLEPMRGGHTDNYYLQMVGQNRLRKGARPLPTASVPKTINVTGDFSDWASVGPEFRDAAGDTAWRNFASAASQAGIYTNSTGRNDFTLLKAARDSNYLYFYAECRSNLTSYAGSNWMVLFLDTDQNHATGWEGYDFAVNLSGVGSSTTTLSRNTTTTNGWTWTPVRGDIPYKVLGNKLMFRLARADLALGPDPISFDFHWADNFQVPGDISAFGVNGDSAPDRRFNYRYQLASLQPITLLQDDFENGKQSGWAETWTNGSKWNLTTATSYSSNTCARCNTANGTSQSLMITRLDTSSLESFRVSFHYKLSNVSDAQNVNLQYQTASGWVTIREISRDQYYSTGQAWSYDERQNVWLNFTDARSKAGTNAQFFGKNFAFRVDGTGVSSSSRSLWVDDFLITGVPVNRPPVIAPVSNLGLIAGQTLLLTNHATDPDLPAQTLTWSLLTAPTGATLDSATGVFVWRPTIAQSSSTNSVSIVVADSGSPSLTATQTFRVTVSQPVAPVLGAPAASNGQFTVSISGNSGPDYAILVATNLSVPMRWSALQTTTPPRLPFLFQDPIATNSRQRYYRVLLGP